MYTHTHTHTLTFCYSFRHGLNLPRSSLPLVVARACIRVGMPEKMIHFVRDPVHYGVFPSTRVYNIIMDAMLKRKKPKGVAHVRGTGLAVQRGGSDTEQICL